MKIDADRLAVFAKAMVQDRLLILIFLSDGQDRQNREIGDAVYESSYSDRGRTSASLMTLIDFRMVRIFGERGGFPTFKITPLGQEVFEAAKHIKIIA